MQVFCCITSAFLFLNSLRKGRNIYNPRIWLYGLWTVILVCSLLRLYGIKETEDTIYTIIFIGLVSFEIGTILQRHRIFPTIKYRWDKYQFGGKSKINYKFIAFFCIITIFLYGIDFFIAMDYLLEGNSFNSIRMWILETYESAVNPIDARRSFFEQTLRVVLIEPFVTALIPICAIDFFRYGKKRWLYLFTIIIEIFSMLSTGGSRFTILTLVITFALAYGSRKKSKVGLSKKKKRRVAYLSVAGVIGMLYFTIKRSSVGIIEEIYYYITTCIPLFDYWLPHIQKVKHTYGLLSGYGMFRILFLIIEKINEDFVPDVFFLAREYVLQANTFRDVGERSSNSFVTAFYYLYLDGGLLGVFLGMFILGWIGEKFFLRIRKKGEMRDEFILLLLIQGIFFSFVRWQFILTNYALAFFFVNFFFKKVKNSNEEM